MSDVDDLKKQGQQSLKIKALKAKYDFWLLAKWFCFVAIILYVLCELMYVFRFEGAFSMRRVFGFVLVTWLSFRICFDIALDLSNIFSIPLVDNSLSRIYSNELEDRESYYNARMLIEYTLAKRFSIYAICVILFVVSVYFIAKC